MLLSTALRCERAERQINDLLKAKNYESPDHQDENIDMPQIYYHKYLLRRAEAVEPVSMQQSWIENIIKVPIPTYIVPITYNIYFPTG